MQLGRYTVEGEVGRGGAGVVLRARGLDGAVVAIKVLLKTDRAASVDRFSRERQVHEQLARSGGFVPLLESGECPQGPYLVMPFLLGGTLRDRLGEEPWPVEEVARLGKALAQALGRAHELGVVHRDLKPENVLYDERGRPFIADLGLAKHLESAGGVRGITQTGTIAGTVGYAPPEQMLDAKHVGPQADVFALGVMLYECLTGAAPFSGANAVEVANRMISGSYAPIGELRPDAPARLREVIERCLEPEPDARYADAGALAAALARPAPSSRIAAVRRPGPGGAGRRSSAGAAGGSPSLLVGGLVACVVVLALALVVVSRRANVPPPVATAPPPVATAPPAGERPPRIRTRPEAPAERVPPDDAQPTVDSPTSTPSTTDDDALPPTVDAPTSTPSTVEDGAGPDDSRRSLVPTRATALSATVGGLGGLDPLRTHGSPARRFTAPLRFLASTPGDLLVVDALGFVHSLDAGDLHQRYTYRMSTTTPSAFAAAPDGSVIGVASRDGVVVTPTGGALTSADVFVVKLAPGSSVTAIAVEADPPLLVYAEGNKIRVVDRAARRLVARIDAHQADVTALALAGRRLISADATGTLVAWRVGLGPEDCGRERTIGTHGHAVACLAISRSGALVVSADAKGTWAQWDALAGKPQARLDLPEGGAPLAARFTGDDEVVWGAMERVVVHWPANDPRRGQRNPLGRPSGLAAFSASGAVHIFADPGGFVLGVTDLEGKRELPPDPGHYAPVSGAAACDRGLYTIDVSGRVIFWGRDGAMTPVPSTGRTPLDPDRDLGSIAAARDGRALAVFGGRALRLDRPDGQPRELEGLAPTWVTTLGDERFLAGSDAGELVWLDPDGRALERKRAFRGRVLQVAAAGANVAALGEEDGGVVVAAFGPGADLRVKVPPARPGALAALGGDRVVVGTEAGELRVHHVAGGGEPRVRAAHEGAVLCVTSAPDGRTLVSAGEDDTVAAWRLDARGELELVERREVAGDRIRALMPLTGGDVLIGTARGVGVRCRWAR